MAGMLSEKQYKAIEEQFKAMDLNGDGSITAAELRQVRRNRQLKRNGLHYFRAGHFRYFLKLFQ